MTSAPVDLAEPAAPSREHWLRQQLLALWVGLMVYMASWVVLPQELVPVAFGAEWQSMSLQPLLFLDPAHAVLPKPENWFPHRLLAPLIAHYVGMGGELWVPFLRIVAVLLLSLVFQRARLLGAARSDALLVTAAVAFTGAIQVYKATNVGYADNVGHVVALLAWLLARHSLSFWFLLLLGLVNHEMSAFFLPWFWFVRRQVGASRSVDALGVIAILGLYAAFRAWIGAHVVTVYDARYFWDHVFLPFSFLWLWLLTAIYHLVMFGPILTIVIWHALRRRPDAERMHTLLVVGGYLCAFVFAYDVNRHSNMIIMPLIVASCRFLGDRRSRLIYLGLVVVSALFATRLAWLFNSITLLGVVDLPGHLLILPDHRFDYRLHVELLVGLVTRAGPLLFGLACETLALVALAQWCARRGIGGSRVSTAGLISAATPGPTVGVLRRATSAMWHGQRARNRRVGS